MLIFLHSINIFLNNCINKHTNINISIVFVQRMDRPYMSESDVWKRQILTYKDGPALKKIKYL